MTRSHPPCRTVYKFLRAVHGRGVCAPLTGQDAAALGLFAHAVALWCASDHDGRRGAFEAMRGALRAMQPGLRWMGRDAIIAIGDYGHVREIWPHVASEFAPVAIPAGVWQEGDPTYMART